MPQTKRAIVFVEVMYCEERDGAEFHSADVESGHVVEKGFGAAIYNQAGKLSRVRHDALKELGA